MTQPPAHRPAPADRLRPSRRRPARQSWVAALLLVAQAACAEPEAADAAAIADLRARVEALERAANLGELLGAQTQALQSLVERLAPPEAQPEPPPPPEPAAAQLAATERRLALLIDQFAVAHQLRLAAVKQASDARAQVNELSARQNQLQLELQEAQLRADKAEKRYAALEQAQERLVSERERLAAELDQTRTRLAEALQQTVALDARLATAEARVAQLEGEARVGKAAGAPARPVPPPGPGPAVPANAEVPPADAPPPAAGDAGDAQVHRPAVYVVRADDSLSKISAAVYGNPQYWQRIYEANRDKLPAPDRLAPGMSLIIP